MSNDDSTVAPSRTLISTVLMIVSFAVVVVASLALVYQLHNPPGDPGGHILARLRLVSDAVPKTSAVLMAFYDEPKPDSLDGIAGTQCLDDVTVQINFRWDRSGKGLIDYASTQLTKLGWSAPSVSPSNGSPLAHWRSQRRGWSVSLENDGPFGWELVAQAPPLGGGRHCG